MKQKKSFSNPALQFISSPADEQAEKEHETRSRRMNILLKPSTAEDLMTLAAANRTSANNLINEIIEEYIESNRDTVNKYNEMFGERKS